MSPQESQALQDFLNQLTQVKGIAKDPQADALIAGAVARQPDAAYLLVQRALLLEQGLNAAKAEIANLQSQLQSAQAGVSRGFLDSANNWGNNPVAAPRQVAPASVPSSQPQAQYAAPPAASGFLGGGAGSMLGTIAATAAGVAGGAFLFQGIESLLGHHHGSGLFGQQNGLAALPAEHTTVNNFYGGNTVPDDLSSLGSGIDEFVADDDSTLI